jgi:hypothetical protein
MGLLGMHADGLMAAKTEMRRADEHFKRLKVAQSIADTKDAWSDFLVYFNRFFTKLEQASKSGKSKGWYDLIKNERKNSSCLSYLLHARNVDEHGIAAIHEDAPGDLRIGAPGEAVSFSGVLSPRGSFGTVKGIGTTATVSQRPPRVELKQVVDRGVPYDPPVNPASPFRDAHTPIELADIGMTALTRIMEEAEKQ